MIMIMIINNNNLQKFGIIAIQVIDWNYSNSLIRLQQLALKHLSMLEAIMKSVVMKEA